jgi:hypothetical protein
VSPHIDPDQRSRSTAAKSGAWHFTQDELSASKWSGSPLSFSAWPHSSSSCFPFGERSRQGEQIIGDSMKAKVQV